MIIIYPTRLKGVELKSYNLLKRLTGAKIPEDYIISMVESHFKYAGYTSNADKLKYLENEKDKNRIYIWELYINDDCVLSYRNEQSATLVVEDIIAALTENAPIFILKEEEKKNDI